MDALTPIENSSQARMEIYQLVEPKGNSRNQFEGGAPSNVWGADLGSLAGIAST